MKFILSFLLILSQVSSVFACNITEEELKFRVLMIYSSNIHYNSLFFPRIPFVNEGNLTKREYNHIIDSVKKIYIPLFKEKGLNFRIEEAWDDDQTNAFAGVRGSDRYILLYGGYARHKLMTKDAYLSVVCHEVGHHLGGFPRKATSNWSSSEGQADYFSTLKCMKEVLRKDEDNESFALSLELPNEVKELCQDQHGIDQEYFICLRSAKAAEEHARVLVALANKESVTKVSLMTPDVNVSQITNLQHPSAQCRLDTKFQGALCNVATTIALDGDDERQGACHPKSLSPLGSRPACWFVHKK